MGYELWTEAKFETLETYIKDLRKAVLDLKGLARNHEDGGIWCQADTIKSELEDAHLRAESLASEAATTKFKKKQRDDKEKGKFKPLKKSSHG